MKNKLVYLTVFILFIFFSLSFADVTQKQRCNLIINSYAKCYDYAGKGLPLDISLFNLKVALSRQVNDKAELKGLLKLLDKACKEGYKAGLNGSGEQGFLTLLGSSEDCSKGGER